MIDIILCAAYLAVLGSVSFFIGRLLPKNMFKSDRSFHIFGFEKNGKFYEKFGIKRWKDRLPDMSRIFPSLMPSKNGIGDVSYDIMIRETRVAEFIHAFIAVLGFPCVLIAPGAAGTVIWLLWVLGNIPFIMIQRYNRPRLERLAAFDKIRREKIRRKGACGNEDIDTELQYR